MGRLGDAWNVLVGRAAPTPAGEIVDLSADPGSDLEQRAYSMVSDVLSVGLAAGGGRRGSRAMLQAHSDVPGVRSIVEHVVGSVASVPWGAYRAKKGRTARNVPKHLRLKMRLGESRDAVLRQMMEAEELEPLPNHPALALIEKPNGHLTSEQVIATVQQHIEYAGNSYLLLERLGRTGQPFEMWPLPPTWVEVKSLQNARTPSGYSIHGGPFQLAHVPLENVIWIKNPDPKDPYDLGSGLAAALNNEIDADEQAALTVSAFMRNRGVPSGVVSFDGADEKTLKPLQEEWHQKYGGPRNAGRLMFTGRKIELKQLTQKLIDMDMVGLRRFLREVLSEHFGVPPEILGRLENSNRATITVAQTIFAIYVLVPRLDRLQDAFNRWLVPMFGDEDTLLLYENPVPDDWDFRLDAAKAAPWAKSINEWRRLTGDPPLEGPIGDAHLIPYTVQAVLPKDMLERTAPAAPTDPEAEPEAEPEEEEDEKAIDPVSAGLVKIGEHVIYKADDSRIRTVLAAVKPKRLLDRARGVMQERIVAWFRRIAEELGTSLNLLQVRRLVELHLAEWATERIAKLINVTTRRALRAALAAGIAAGDGLRGLEGRVSKVFDDARSKRSLLIAESEAVRSSNWAATSMQRIAGVAARAWIHMNDGRVRHAHALLGGQVRGIDEPFVIPSGGYAGATAMYPGGFGRAALDVGCRCLTMPYRGEKLAANHMLGLWKAFDADLRPWERALVTAFRRGFDDQEQDVLRALRRAFGGES